MFRYLCCIIWYNYTIMWLIKVGFLIWGHARNSKHEKRTYAFSCRIVPSLTSATFCSNIFNFSQTRKTGKAENKKYIWLEFFFICWNRFRENFICQEGISQTLSTSEKSWAATALTSLRSWNRNWYRVLMICLAMTYPSFLKTSGIPMINWWLCV